MNVQALLLCALIGNLHDPMASIRSRVHEATTSLHHVDFSQDSSGQLLVTYHAHAVRHRSMSKSGPLPTGSYTSIDPMDDGFVLTTYVFDHKATEPPRAFQSTQKRGDGFEVSDYQIDGADKALYLRIQWGPHTEAKLIERLRTAVTKHATPLP